MNYRGKRITDKYLKVSEEKRYQDFLQALDNPPLHPVRSMENWKTEQVLNEMRNGDSIT